MPPRAGRAGWAPAALLLALAALGVVALVAFVNADQPGLVADPSPTSTPTPAPTDPPWLDDLVAAVERDCDEAIAAEFRADARSMDEEEARDAAGELRDSCKGEKPGKGNGGGGNGGGNGNGNGGD